MRVDCSMEENDRPHLFSHESVIPVGYALQGWLAETSDNRVSIRADENPGAKFVFRNAVPNKESVGHKWVV